MLSGQLSGRARAQSHANIRKKILRSKSEDKPQPTKNATATNFRPKFERLLQEGKIQHIMNTDPHTKADLYYTTHINQLEKELASAKKALGTMVMKSKSKQYNINIIKNDIKKVQRQSSIIQGENFQSKNKLSDKRDSFAQKQIDLENQVWKEKSYKHMKQRLIREEQILKAQHDLKAVQCKNIHDQYVVLDKKYSDLFQMNNELRFTLDKAKKINKQQTEDKNQFIELMNQEMIEKDMLNDLKMQKNQREGQINNLAPSVIEREELEKYKEIMFTHRLVSQIVKVRSQNLMKEYEKVQKGYMHIKSNTNIHQLDKILRRMENQDAEYEKLLKKVSNLEQQILTMEGKMHGQAQHEKKLLSMEGQTRDITKETYQGIQRDNYELLLLEKTKGIDRKTNDEILKKKIIIWTNEYANLYGIEMKQKNEEEFFKKLTLLANSINKHK